MTGQQTAPYGTWHSPITPEMVTEAGIRLGEIKTDGPDVYWLEGRPAEGGRNVIVRSAEPGPVDVTPEGYNVRNRVHEYGGAAYGSKTESSTSRTSPINVSTGTRSASNRTR